MKKQSKVTTALVQHQSKKIQKRSKELEAEILNYICGGCPKAYKSYAALYFHIKRIHNGVKPPGTLTKRPARPKLDINVQPGRPSRPNKDIDELQETEAYLETAQNSLMSFLGEKLTITSLLGRKRSLELVEKEIIECYQDKTDKWTITLLDETKKFVSEYKAKDLKMQHLDFEEDFVHLDAGKNLRIIVWFMIWLAQIHVKIEFIPELCIIFSNIWRVLEEIELGAQDLDNKLVWKKIVKNCEGLMSSLPTFKADTNLLNEFIQKVCHLIGKTFESES